MQEVRVLCVGQDEIAGNLVECIKENCASECSGASASSVEEALDELGSDRFDIVVADADRPELDIVSFLTTVRQKWPAVLRYIVTDARECGQSYALLEICHQVLPKSDDFRLVAKKVSNAISLRDVMKDEKLRARIAGIDSLPCLPETYNQLVSELRNPDSSIKKIASLISNDTAVSANVLKVVNSAYFGLSHRVEDINQAVTILGMNTLQNLVLSAGVFSQFQNLQVPGTSIEELLSDGTRISSMSQLFGSSLGLSRRDNENSLLSGMLLDFGKLVMAKYFQEEFKSALEASRKDGIPLDEAEHKLIGTDDPTLGAYILSTWGLPDTIVEAVAFHQRPSKCPQPVIGALTLVHLAWAFQRDEKQNIVDGPKSSVDPNYLSAVELSDHIPMLRNLSTAAV